MWAALARAATEELRDRQFAALSDRQAQAILQASAIGYACGFAGCALLCVSEHVCGACSGRARLGNNGSL